MLEIVIDGLAPEPVREAMRVGLDAAARAGARQITAGNYGGSLGAASLPPAGARAVTLTLTLREAPAAPVVAEALRPDRLAGLSRAEIERLELWHGNRRAALGELFDVSGAGEEDVRVEGDLARVAGLGTGMAGGRLTLAGDAGPHVGAGMRGRRARRRGRRGRLGRRRDARRAAGRARLRRPPARRRLRGGARRHARRRDPRPRRRRRGGGRRPAARADRRRRARRRGRRPARARRHDRRARRRWAPTPARACGARASSP